MASKTSKSRLASPRGRISKSKIAPGKSAGAVDIGVIREELLKILTSLRGAMDVSYTCEGALNHQNGDGDSQIAKVLRLYCNNRIYASMLQTAQIILFLDGKGWPSYESGKLDRLLDEA